MKRVCLLAGFCLVLLTLTAASVNAAPSCSTPDPAYKDLLGGLPDEIAAGRSIEFLTNATQQPLELEIVSQPPGLVSGPVLFAWTLSTPIPFASSEITVTAKWDAEDPTASFAACEQSLSRTVTVVSPVSPAASVIVVPTPQKGDQNTFLNISIEKQCVVGARGPITFTVASGPKKVKMKLSDQCSGKWSKRRKLSTFSLVGGDDYSNNRYLSIRQNGKRPGRKRYLVTVTWQGKRLLQRKITSITRFNARKNRLIRRWTGAD